MAGFFYDDLSWQPALDKENKPIYMEIVNALRHDIKRGVLQPGDKLPPQRELADFLGINLSTVTRAFKICEQRGLIFATVGKGTFISSDVLVSEATTTADGTSAPNLIDLGMILPLHDKDQYIIEAMRHVASGPDVEDCLSYGAPQKKAADCELGVAWLQKMHFSVTPEHIFVVSGVQNALAIILTSLFSAGDKIATDRFTYTGFKNLANMLGIRLVPVDMDKDGMDANELRRVCRSDKVKGIYLMAECQNPTACCMPRARREQIAQVIRENGLILLEDDTYAFLNNTGLKPISAHVPEQSVYISGTSKALSAGLRVAFLAVAQAFRARIDLGIRNINLMTSHFNTEIVAHLVRTGAADEIIRKKRLEAQARCALAQEIFEGFDLRGTHRDYFRWLILPPGVHGRDFEAQAKGRGVNVFCAEKFVVGSDFPFDAVRVSLSAAPTREQLRHGLCVLRDLLTQKPQGEPFII
ncbi:MAG: PLP-dependent aminotransferase family protein [Christensenella sp.]|uniref:aminotransferase-like domain-containing protein n=1 Tax=Christensenella sp. TaxID=1935934 RepID=UPI002B1F9476|nr:PLP-dependent aminotransferase family protein [Christensenella sp.]MEA5003026.1 PLP-dependent aminotransferase family protein [Christensenella sp.]